MGCKPRRPGVSRGGQGEQKGAVWTFPPAEVLGCPSRVGARKGKAGRPLSCIFSCVKRGRPAQPAGSERGSPARAPRRLRGRRGAGGVRPLGTAGTRAVSVPSAAGKMLLPRHRLCPRRVGPERPRPARCMRGVRRRDRSYRLRSARVPWGWQDVRWVIAGHAAGEGHPQCGKSHPITPKMSGQIRTCWVGLAR